MSDLTIAASAALAELSTLIAPLQRLSAELRHVPKLKLPPDDEPAAAEALAGLTASLRAAAASAQGADELAATLKQIRTTTRDG